MVGCNTAHVQREFIIARSIFDRIFCDPASSDDHSRFAYSTYTFSPNQRLSGKLKVTMLGSIEVNYSLFKINYFVCHSPALHVFVLHDHDDHGHGRTW